MQVRFQPSESTILGKRQQPEPQIDEDEAKWVGLGRAMTAFKRAKRAYQLSIEDLYSAAKGMPVRIDAETISAAASDHEN